MQCGILMARRLRLQLFFFVALIIVLSFLFWRGRNLMSSKDSPSDSKAVERVAFEFMANILKTTAFDLIDRTQERSRDAWLDLIPHSSSVERKSLEGCDFLIFSAQPRRIDGVDFDHGGDLFAIIDKKTLEVIVSWGDE